MKKVKVKDLKLKHAKSKKVKGGALFIKFDGVEGEAQDKDHKGWSDVLSYQQTIIR